ncbi:MAG: uridylate kinase [Patescibacteria group bacterium]|jgi:uridylate kinase
MKRNVRKTWVISLGGSRIVPENVDQKFLNQFKKLILSHPGHKFVVVTGGGNTARKYIDALRGLHGDLKKQSQTGVAITRFHANFLMRIFGKPANDELPFSVKKVESLLRRNQVVFCGALQQRKNQTSDTTAARVAAHLECPFINLTNVKGIYTDNPATNPKAKFIPKISWDDFYAMANKLSFTAGQHFVLDQKGSKIIRRKKVPTYIVGSLISIRNIINGRNFAGSLIKG